MKAGNLLAPQRPVPRDAHPHDGTIVTDRVDEVWGTDMTQTVTTQEGRAYVFIAVDHCSGEFIGTHASSRASRWEALEPIRQGLTMPGCIRDASPDAWGRRVIINCTMGLAGDAAAAVELDELTYLLESGSDRTGALGFQTSATAYVQRVGQRAPLATLLEAAELVERGVPLSPELDLALRHGSSLGGARPKAMVEDRDTKYIAKLSASNDLYSVVKAEFIAMRLAQAPAALASRLCALRARSAKMCS